MRENKILKKIWMLGICLLVSSALVGCYSETALTEDSVPTPTPLQEKLTGVDPHVGVYNTDQYPSASKCAPCHEQIYDEWRSSNHAYAAISPMFHKFEQKLHSLAPTKGAFCVRCHMSVGTTLGEPRDMPLWKRAQVSREGVTCISCHRITESYARGFNGMRRIVPGDIHKPIYGTRTGEGVKHVVENKTKYKVATNDKETGPAIHLKGIKFEQLDKSEYCASCHQVAIYAGIKLEVVYEQYLNSPARKKGITCQECHMGLVPGEPKGFAKGPVAVVNGVPIEPDGIHANHAFYGPGYPITHPGIFPHHKEGERFDMQTWLKFDYRAGWGTEEFEEKLENGDIKVDFPAEWEEVDDRFDARDIVTSNIGELEKKRDLRRRVMENGSRIDGPFFESKPIVGNTFNFSYKITNIDLGHNLPSGSLGAQPELWFNVALIDPDGVNIWETGYLDSLGDMCDLHSYDVRAGTIKHDDQLFNLQTKFLTTNIKGTDREMYLPVNLDLDQRPVIRPDNFLNSLMNHPRFVRMEGRSLPPLGYRYAEYTVPAELMKKKGTYRLASRMRSRAEPIYFMRFCDATPEMEQAMNEWMLDIHPYSVEFEVE